jgi:hypothetical protein
MSYFSWEFGLEPKRAQPEMAVATISFYVEKD